MIKKQENKDPVAEFKKEIEAIEKASKEADLKIMQDLLAKQKKKDKKEKKKNKKLAKKAKKSVEN